MDDVILNKIESIERCIRQIKKYYNPESFDHDTLQQDGIILNLQRAIQQSIDIGTHIVRIKRLGLPKESRQIFDLLHEASLLSNETKEIMSKMITFRNIAILEYVKLDMHIVRDVVSNRLKDLKKYAKEISIIELK